MNGWDIAILAAVALALGLAVRSRIKKGRSGCGSCCGDCAACAEKSRKESDLR